MSNLKEFLKELHNNHKIQPETNNDCDSQPKQDSDIGHNRNNANGEKKTEIRETERGNSTSDKVNSSNFNHPIKDQGGHEYSHPSEKEGNEVLKSDQFKIESLDSETSYFDSLAEDDPYGDNVELGKYEKDIENVIEFMKD
jgi:hypothetical protein